MADKRDLTFDNGFVLTLACDGERFLGIGEVRYNGTPLRNPQLPWTFYIESDDGFRFDTFRLANVSASSTEAAIEFTAEGEWMPRVQEADAMTDSRIRTRRLRRPTATFSWSFRAITEKIWENEWDGLAMRLEAQIPGHPTNWVLEDTTWEIGGEAAGATLIQQDMSSIDLEQSVEADSTFTTIERFFTDEDLANQEDADSWLGNFPMDMMPRGGGSAPLDFQTKDDLALILFAEKPDLTRARLEKFKSENVIHYADRPFFPLTDKIALPERKLLVYRHTQALERHEWRNLWLDAFTEARRRIHASYGFTLEIPRPLVWAFLWNFDLEVYMEKWTEPLLEALPQYKRLGFNDVFTHGVFDGTSNHFDVKGRNICLNYDYRYCEEFGGNKVMKRLFDAAHKLGMKTWQWFGMYLDRRSPLWDENPDWIEHDAGGKRLGGAGRMRSGFRDYLLNAIKKIKDETGLDAIFWDSYQNTGLTNIEWGRPDKAPHAEEVWRLQAELQKYGMHHRCETVTIFGITNVGMYAFEGDDKNWSFRRRDWSHTPKNDDAFVWLDCSPAFFNEEAFTADKFSPKHYFWFMGHRSVPTFGVRPWGPEYKGKPVAAPYLPGRDLAEEYGRCNHLYHTALPHMHRLRLTEGGKYTLWLGENNQPSVIWAFENAEAPYTGAVTDIETGREFRVEGELKLEAGKVYLLGERTLA